MLSKAPRQKRSSSSGRQSDKTTTLGEGDGPKRLGDRGVHSLPQMRGENSDPTGGRPGANSELDDNPLVSGPIAPVTMPIELQLPGTGQKASLRALLDSGCTRCLVSPALVEKLRIRPRRLKCPIAFCQLNGSVVGGIPAMFVTEPLEMQMGAHSETLSFIVAPGMERPLVLGLAWLKRWNPQVDWRKGLLKFPPGRKPT